MGQGGKGADSVVLQAILMTVLQKKFFCARDEWVAGEQLGAGAGCHARCPGVKSLAWGTNAATKSQSGQPAKGAVQALEEAQ